MTATGACTEDYTRKEVPMKHILVAVDDTPGARRAVTEGIELARKTGAAVTFLAVRHRIRLLGNPHYQHRLTKQLARFRPVLDEAVAEAESAGVEADAEIQEGDVVDEILRIAVYRESEAIVVGSRGLGPFTGAMLGSVSLAVLEHAPVPVVVAGRETAIGV
jgi:nucleotide-binding universal stress UspA family protein